MLPENTYVQAKVGDEFCHIKDTKDLDNTKKYLLDVLDEVKEDSLCQCCDRKLMEDPAACHVASKKKWAVCVVALAATCNSAEKNFTIKYDCVGVVLCNADHRFGKPPCKQDGCKHYRVPDEMFKREPSEPNPNLAKTRKAEKKKIMDAMALLVVENQRLLAEVEQLRAEVARLKRELEERTEADTTVENE